MGIYDRDVREAAAVLAWEHVLNNAAPSRCRNDKRHNCIFDFLETQCSLALRL